MGGDLGEEHRDVVRQGLCVGALDLGEDGGDRAVQRELDQHAGGGRHRTGHGVEEAARTPVEQGAQHDEQQVVGVQPGDGGDRRLGGELLVQPAGRQGHQQQDQDRAVLQPLAGAGALRRRWGGEGRIDTTVLGAARTVRSGRGGVGDDQRDDHQRGQHHPGLPEEDGFGERNDAGDRQDRRRQAGRVGLQLCSRRRQAQRPHRAQAQVGSSARGAVVHLQVRAAGQGTHQQAAEHQRQTPVEQGGEHRDQRHPAHRRAAVLRQAREAVDQARSRRRACDHIAANDHEGHLHGERDQAPEPVTKGLGGVGGLGAHGQGAQAHQHHGQGGEHPGVGEPAFGPVGAAQGKAGGAAVLDFSGHECFPFLVLLVDVACLSTQNPCRRGLAVGAGLPANTLVNVPAHSRASPPLQRARPYRGEVKQ
ncbi:MAG: hypothetical protein GAK45_02222 [Pseudomonas citronellolis]|nr:MAG: hypothetical protein GAK45_02222 [Pseudomonas citronellolis]